MSLNRRRGALALALTVALIALALPWWARRQSQNLGQELAKMARAGDIHMLSSNTCAICVTARAWFKANAVTYSECTIETDRDCAKLFEASRSPGTPVILVRGTALIGFEPQRIRAALTPG